MKIIATGNVTSILKYCSECLSGWEFFNRSCYRAMRLNSSFSLKKATNACSEQGEDSHLASVHSLAEMG